MHDTILVDKQKRLLPLVHKFSKDFGLVGGTAIALYIGHRRSIDFDLFTDEEFDNLAIRKKIYNYGKKIEYVFLNLKDEYTVLVGGVKFTFFHYPFKIKFSKNLDHVIKLPDLLTLAAMKAHALGRRAKWRDYVDLYFITKQYHGLDAIIKKAHQIFGAEFNEKMFRTQLSYFEDIDHSEKIIFMKGFEVSDQVVEGALKKVSLT